MVEVQKAEDLLFHARSTEGTSLRGVRLIENNRNMYHGVHASTAPTGAKEPKKCYTLARSFSAAVCPKAYQAPSPGLWAG